IGHAVVAGGGGIFEVAGSGLVPADDRTVTASELDWMGRLAAEPGLTTPFILLQCDDAPTRWRREMQRAAEWRRRGAQVVPLIAGRPFGIIWNWEVRHPFSFRDTYRSIAHLAL